jgi:hypothetical protein
MAIATIGAVVRLIEIRLEPRYGKRIGNERGYMTKMAERMKITKVTIENRVIIMWKNIAWPRSSSCLG